MKQDIRTLLVRREDGRIESVKSLCEMCGCGCVKGWGGGGERKGPRGEGGEGMKEKKEVECNGVRIEGNKRGVTQE